MEGQPFTAETDPAFLVCDVATCVKAVLPPALRSWQPSHPVPGAGRLPQLADEEAQAFLQDVQSPWTALFEVAPPQPPAEPVIMARWSGEQRVCLPV